jgi:hypothetical protein
MSPVVESEPPLADVPFESLEAESAESLCEPLLLSVALAESEPVTVMLAEADSPPLSRVPSEPQAEVTSSSAAAVPPHPIECRIEPPS